MNVITNFVANQEHGVQIAALRALSNSLLAQVVGKLRAVLRSGEEADDFRALFTAWLSASQECASRAQAQYEQPMEVSSMIEFFKQNSGIDKDTASAVSEVSGLSTEQLEQMHANKQAKEAEQLEADQPQLITLFEHYQSSLPDDMDLAEALNALSAETQERLVSKVGSGLSRAVGRLSEVIVSQGRSDLLGELTVLKAGAEAFQAEAA